MESVSAVSLLSSKEGLGVHGGGGCRKEAMLASWGCVQAGEQAAEQTACDTRPQGQPRSVLESQRSASLCSPLNC